MFRKSVHLFSVALLGLSLVPSNAWADEIAEPAVPNVTTEFIESPTVEVEQAVSEPEIEVSEPQPEPEVVPEEPEEAELIEEPVAVETELPEQESAPKEKVALEATPEPEKEAVTSQVNISQQVVAEPADTIQQPRAARATTPVLKDDYDGKIVDHEKAITDEDAKITAEYNFMPNFDNLDDIVVTSNGGFLERSTYYLFDLTTESANSIEVIYKNVGTYNGKVVDMKVTVKDWTAFSGSVYNQLYIYKGNGISMHGISDVRLNYYFIDNVTSAAMNVSGFFNFTDIDLRQSIDLFDHNNVQNYYVTKDNQLYFKSHNGYIRIGEIDGKGTSDFDMDHWLTYTYKNVSNFDVRYNQDYETGAVFNYTYQAPIVIEEKPTKPVEKEPEEVEEPIVIEETPEKEIVEKEVELTVPVVAEKKTETFTVIPTVKATVKAEKVEPVETQDVQAKPLKQVVLPQTNDQTNTIFTILGGACLFLLGALFLNRKKV